MAGSIFITGASRGIGLALSVEFAKAGWNVFAGARRPDLPGLTAVAREFPTVKPVRIDVLDESAIRAAVLAVRASADSLEILVNNAAVFPGEGDERLEELDMDWFSEAFDTNVVGPARVTRAFLPLLRAAQDAKVINVSSGAGSIAEKTDHHYYPYSVSKAALNMLTRAMAADLAGMIVVAMSPGWVATEMGGPNAPLTTKESASALCASIQALAHTDSGSFLGRDGTPTGYTW